MDNNETQKIPEQNVKNLLMLLDGALRYTQYVKRGIEQDDVHLRNENVGKAITIISQLDASLDKSVGGEIAENLSGLYKFLMNQLTQANLQLDASLLDDAIKIITDIKEAFEGAAKNYLDENVEQEMPSQGRGLTIDI